MSQSGQSQLFRSFGKDKVSGHSQLKASVQRAIRGEAGGGWRQRQADWRCCFARRGLCFAPASVCRQRNGSAEPDRAGLLLCAERTLALLWGLLLGARPTFLSPWPS